MEDFLQVLVAHDAVYGAGLAGIEITPQFIRISGFGEAPDIRTLKAYGQLAVLMATRSRELRYIVHCTRTFSRSGHRLTQ